MIRKCYKFYTLIMTLMWVMAAMTACYKSFIYRILICK